MQRILFGNDGINELPGLMGSAANPLLVCESFFVGSPVYNEIEALPLRVTVFGGFSPNPKDEEAEAGFKVYAKSGCDSIIAVGGGSAIDTAKAIRRKAGGGDAEKTASIPFVAIPTTAGTGSESTRFAVIYKNGEKQSLSGDELLPDAALLMPCLLSSLPIFQRKCTVLDALCQATESYWSVSSTEESRELSKKAIGIILKNIYDYTEGSTAADGEIMTASNLAGQAICITTTTAPHAMSYKLTSNYGIPHGLAVALTFPGVIGFMSDGRGECVDPRGREFLNKRLAELASFYGCEDVGSWADEFRTILKRLGLSAPAVTEGEAEALASSVNAQRLKNNPVFLTAEELKEIYLNM